MSILSSMTFVVTATDSNGCIQQDFLVVNIDDDKALFIPNVFTPNDDFVNDQFFISTNYFAEEIEELSIFDRWGNHVFQRINFQPNDPALGWDGRMKNKLMNQGVYAWKARVRFRNGEVVIKWGDVTLLR